MNTGHSPLGAGEVSFVLDEKLPSRFFLQEDGRGVPCRREGLSGGTSPEGDLPPLGEDLENPQILVEVEPSFSAAADGGVPLDMAC